LQVEYIPHTNSGEYHAISFVLEIALLSVAFGQYSFFDFEKARPKIVMLNSMRFTA